MAISTGWTWDYVGNNVDLPRLAALTKYWTHSPPMHLLLKAYVGFKAPAPIEVVEAQQNAELSNILSDAPKYVFVPPVKVNNGQRS